MTDALIEGGTLLATEDPRVFRGLLMPWGETGKTNLGPLRWARGTVKLPRSTETLMANVGHDREQVVGRFTEVTDTERGLEVAVRIADTDEGDALLAQLAEGQLSKLSVEVKNVIRRGAEAVSGVLFGGAFVTAGAFDSASLYAELASDEELAAAVTDEPLTPVEGVIAVQATELPESVLVAAGEATQEYTPTPTPESEEIEMAVATAPNTLQAASTANSREKDAQSVFELITAAKSGASEETLMAALADIKISGSGALPSTGVIQPSWLGEVWAGVEPTRRYHSLVKNGNIVALEEKGFAISTGGELVKSWAGNKAELPTGTATTSVLSGDALQKWGFAADIAQEFYMVEAGKPVIEAFTREIFRSYARVTDKYALQKIYAAAGTARVAGTYPAGYSSAIGKLIEGVDIIDDSDVAPTFAVVAPDVYRELRFTPKDQIPEYVNFAVGRQDGTADGVTIVRDKAGVLAAGQVLVGGRDFAHINELPNSPLQLDALDIAHGGLDKSVLGLSQWMTEYSSGVVLIGNAA